MSSRYAFSLTTFSPSGKLGQIEHALTAVAQGVTAVALKAANGIVIATEKKAPTPLVDRTSLAKVSTIAANIGMVYSGMGPDARVLLDKARKCSQEYKRVYMEEIPVLVLVKEVASIMQEYTQSGGVRPFGVSLLIAGVDASGPKLYQVDPSGSYWAWKASAIGKNMVNAKTFLEKRYVSASEPSAFDGSELINFVATHYSDIRRYSATMEIEDAVHTAILTLKEGMEGVLSENMIEIGIAQVVPTLNRDGELVPKEIFRSLSDSEIKDYLANIA